MLTNDIADIKDKQNNFIDSTEELKKANENALNLTNQVNELNEKLKSTTEQADKLTEEVDKLAMSLDTQGKELAQLVKELNGLEEFAEFIGELHQSLEHSSNVQNLVNERLSSLFRAIARINAILHI